MTFVPHCSHLRNRDDKCVFFQLPFNFLVYYLCIHIFIYKSTCFLCTAQCSFSTHLKFFGSSHSCAVCTKPSLHQSRNAVGQSKCFLYIFSTLADPHDFLPLFLLAAYVSCSSLAHSEEFFFPEHKESLWCRAKDFLEG